MESNKKIRLLILTRHGERIDKTHKRTSQKLKTDDPELTVNGRQQALKMGSIIALYVEKHFNIKLNSDITKIVTSPFSRTIQTSLNLAKSYFNYPENNIRIDNKLCELIFPSVVGDFPNKYVAIYNKNFSSDINCNEFKNNFEYFEKKSFEFENSDMINVKSLPLKYESNKDVVKRANEVIDEYIKNYFINNSSSIEVINFVSHAGTLNIIYECILKIIYKNNEEMLKKIDNGFNDIEYNIQYCDSFIFKVNIDEDSSYTFELIKKLSLF